MQMSISKPFISLGLSIKNNIFLKSIAFKIMKFLIRNYYENVDFKKNIKF